jgi:hypothetical protein
MRTGAGRKFRPEWKEVAGGCKILHYEERHNFYSSPDIITVTKS